MKPGRLVLLVVVMLLLLSGLQQARRMQTRIASQPPTPADEGHRDARTSLPRARDYVKKDCVECHGEEGTGGTGESGEARR